MTLPRFLPVLALLLVAVVSPRLHAEQPPAAGREEFPGVQKVLTPEQFSAAGLNKLSPAERAQLDAALRAYVGGATERVATQAAAQASAQAVDRAVKERRVEPPTVIQARIVGVFDGWNYRTVWRLDNGQRWKPAENTPEHYTPVKDAPVLIVKTIFGYQMSVAGGGIVRVRQL